MAAPLVGIPTESGIIGKYRNAEHQDIFQTLDADGSTLAAMNYQGLIYAGKGNAYASVTPIVGNVRITAAQLLVSGTTPVQLVPAPGAGLFIYPQSFIAQYNAGTTPYTVTGSNGVFVIYWAGQPSPTQSNTPGAMPDTAFVDQTVSGLYVSSCYLQSSVQVPLTQAVNQPLYLKCLDTLSLGNGSMIVNISYAILPTP